MVEPKLSLLLETLMLSALFLSLELLGFVGVDISAVCMEGSDVFCVGLTGFVRR